MVHIGLGGMDCEWLCRGTCCNARVTFLEGFLELGKELLWCLYTFATSFWCGFSGALKSRWVVLPFLSSMGRAIHFHFLISTASTQCFDFWVQHI